MKQKIASEKNAQKKYKNGDIGLIFHIRDGKVEWIEKINRTTEKPVKNPPHVKIIAEQNENIWNNSNKY